MSEAGAKMRQVIAVTCLRASVIGCGSSYDSDKVIEVDVRVGVNVSLAEQLCHFLAVQLFAPIHEDVSEITDGHAAVPAVGPC